MLAAVAFNATGMNSVLKGANGVADRLETTLLTTGEARHCASKTAAGRNDRTQQSVAFVKWRYRVD